MKCLVTGASGFLGRYVVSGLKQAGYEVTTLGPEPTNEGKHVRADLTSPEIDLGNAGYAAVFHLAGLAHLVPRNEAERRQFHQVNVEGTKRLLHAVATTGRVPEAVVLTSTVAVYGLEEGMLLDEHTPRNAIDPYGASKKEAEDVLSEWCGRYGVRASIARLPLVAGRNAPGNFGAMVRAMASGQYWGIGSGSVRRSMVLAQDLAGVFPRLASSEGVFHLTDGHHPSFRELEEALCDAMKRAPPRRIPLAMAWGGAYVGDAIQRATGLRMPLNWRTFAKMTSTLTFSDARARRDLAWCPSSVLEHAMEWF